MFRRGFPSFAIANQSRSSSNAKSAALHSIASLTTSGGIPRSIAVQNARIRAADGRLRTSGKWSPRLTVAGFGMDASSRQVMGAWRPRLQEDSERQRIEWHGCSLTDQCPKERRFAIVAQEAPTRPVFGRITCTPEHVRRTWLTQFARERFAAGKNITVQSSKTQTSLKFVLCAPKECLFASSESFSVLGTATSAIFVVGKFGSTFD